MSNESIIKNDLVKIGSKDFQINRDAPVDVIHRLTKEAYVLDEWTRKPTDDTILEMSYRSDKWAVEAMQECLIEFDVNVLKEFKNTKIFNVLAGRIFWAVRTDTSFLAIPLSNSPDTAQPKKD